MIDPFFSIIIPTFNSEKTLERALKSLFEQSCTDWEAILIDGVSTDRTLEISRQYENRFAKIISEPDAGVTDAWNKGLKFAKGQWVYFLGSDDEFAGPNVLSEIMLRLKDTTAKIFYAPVRVVSDVGAERRIVNTLPWNQLKIEFCKTSCLCHQGVLTKRSLFSEIGAFNPSYKIAADYDFLHRAKTVSNFENFPSPLISNFYVGGISSQLSSSWRAVAEISEILKKNGYRSLNSTMLWIRLKLAVKTFLYRLGLA